MKRTKPLDEVNQAVAVQRFYTLEGSDITDDDIDELVALHRAERERRLAKGKKTKTC